MFKSSLSCCSCSAGPPHFTWLWPTRPADLIRLIEIWTWPDSSSGSGLGYRKPLTLAHRVHWHKLSAEGAKMSKCSFKAALWGHSEEQRGVQWHSLVKVLWLRQKRKAFSWVCRRLRSELSSISRKPPTNRFLLVCEAPDTSTPPPPRQLSESVGEHDKEHQEQTKVTTPQTNKEEEKELQVSPDAWQRTWRRRFPQLQKKKKQASLNTTRNPITLCVLAAEGRSHDHLFITLNHRIATEPLWCLLLCHIDTDTEIYPIIN